MFDLAICNSLNSILDYVKTYAPQYTEIVQSFQDRYATSKWHQKQNDPNTVEYQLETCKQYQLYEECKSFLEERLPNTVLRTDEKVCTSCGGELVNVQHNSTEVCIACGISKQVINNEQYDYVRTTTYNCKQVHRYSPEEHFAQIVHDFCGLSNRTIPDYVMEYCLQKAKSMKQKQVTHRMVFNWLCEKKFREYYSLKYIIANRLRDTREFHITLQEANDLKLLFKTYIRAIYPFMVEANIGYISSRGKYRNYWPTAFILQRLLERIHREDLVKYVIVENTKARYQLYLDYWHKLEAWMKTKQTHTQEFHQENEFTIEYYDGIKTKRTKL